MKRITFKSLKLLNFCGIRKAEYNFGENITVIKGRNGIGKSTIVNAILYVLFDKDSNGKSFDIKTFDKNHNIIPELEHSAELLLSVDGEDISLKRSLTDKWKGKECKNTYKYFIDGEVSTAGDFKKTVDAICPEVIFRLESSPTYFTSLPWEKQRKFLEQIVPEVTAKTITQGNSKFDFVVEALKKENIDKILHHLKYKRNEIQKELNDIPVRLRELESVQVDAENWSALDKELVKKNAEKESVNKQINDIKNGTADYVLKESLHKKIEFQRKRIEEMEKGARNLSSESETKHMSDILNAKKAKATDESVVEELKAKMGGFTDTEIHLNEQITQQKSNIKNVGEEYARVNTEKWQWDRKESICPHCGQALPIAEVEQLRRESEKRFNEKKASRLKELLEQADKIKREHVECKSLLEQLQNDRVTTSQQLVKAHKALAEAEKHLAEVEKDMPRTYGEILNANENYKQAQTELKKLEEELDKPKDISKVQHDMLESLQIDKEALETEIKSLVGRLAKKESYDRISNKIEQARKDKETYQNQLDELDMKLEIANEYSQLSCSILEEEVNKHFHFVKWSLFSTNLDGERKPFCECYHDGVPYSRLNSAAKINAGIDIAYVISDFYKVSIPMLLDECESNISPIYREESQQIRLYVTHDEEMKFEYHGSKD